MAHPFPAVPLGFSVTCVEAWLAATGSARGYVMDLGTLWRLAAHRDDGRLDRGYIGLSGPFWGL